MSTDTKRRVFLKGSLAASTLGVVAGAGLLTPQTVFAAWPKSAFSAKSVDSALTDALGSAKTQASDKIKIKAPDIAENGAVVPVSVSTSIEGVKSISILSVSNVNPLVAEFVMGAGQIPNVSTRIKMGKTGDVVAVINADGKLYSARKSVKVTIGGCGG